MIKKILRSFLFLACLVVVIWGIQKTPLAWPWKKISLPDGGVFEMTDLNPLKIERPDWNADQVLEKLNQYRLDNGMAPFKENEKLHQAAKARLAMMLAFDDYEGTQTGMTRESAAKATGYTFSWLGDLLLLNTSKDVDLIESWKSLGISNETLLQKNLSEVGVAIVQDSRNVSVYVMLASPRIITPMPSKPKSYSGPDLWKAVNESRVNHGVNALKQKDELCTVAAIRLNQILDLGKLDGHAGFEPTLNRPDLKYISEQLNVSEFLISGYSTPELAVKAWEDTLGHKKLLTGGEYVWGCIYAQNLFGVAIAGY